MNPKIAKIVVDLPIEGPFDYLIPEDLQGQIKKGMRVWIPFGRSQRLGYVIGLEQKSEYVRLKSLTGLLENIPSISSQLLKFTEHFSLYYGCSWGEAIEMSVPTGLRKKHILDLAIEKKASQPVKKKAQNEFWHNFGEEDYVKLLIDRIQDCLKRGEGVLYLLPESILVENVIEELRSKFGDVVAVFDKQLSAKEELAEWTAIREGKKLLVVGTRSAIFAPVSNLGLIIIGEEQSPSFRQEQKPFYHIREASLLRAKLADCSLLFISAAPTVELWHLAKKKKFIIKRFDPSVKRRMRLMDLSGFKFIKQSMVSLPLLERIRQASEHDQRIVLLLNRRGFAHTTQCNQCGCVIKCERCNVHYTLRHSDRKLVCPLCGIKTEMPKVCPQCQGRYLRSIGVGIEKVVSEMSRVFPQLSIVKFDSASSRLPEKYDMIVGTQAVMKVLDQIHPDLIAVLNIDLELNRFDYRSGQKVFWLLSHLRNKARAELVVQTYQPSNYVLQASLAGDSDGFYKQELRLRREMHLSPFFHMVAINLRSKDEQKVQEAASDLAQLLKQHVIKEIEVLDPQAHWQPKLRGQFRFMVLLKGPTIPEILKCVRKTLCNYKRKSKVILTIEVDP